MYSFLIQIWKSNASFAHAQLQVQNQLAPTIGELFLHLILEVQKNDQTAHKKNQIGDILLYLIYPSSVSLFRLL